LNLDQKLLVKAREILLLFPGAVDSGIKSGEEKTLIIFNIFLLIPLHLKNNITL